MIFPIKKIWPGNFPYLLQQINDPPKYIYLQGDIPSQENYTYLTVVGSRKYSSYGKQVCQKLISGLANFPIVVVSGLAIGIDTIAHRAALDCGLKTISVPGSGLDNLVLYPRSNHALAREILESGGAIISELEPKEKATIWSFPKRNRIMAGLSKATLIIEASEKSGTLITARLALDYNRDVLVVPNSILHIGSNGSNNLIKQGAIPVSSVDDIIEVLGFKKENKKNTRQDQTLKLSESEKNILDKLKTGPLTKDELTQKTGLTTSEINSAISLMELRGLIKNQFGKIILI